MLLIVSKKPNHFFLNDQKAIKVFSLFLLKKAPDSWLRQKNTQVKKCQNF